MRVRLLPPAFLATVAVTFVAAPASAGDVATGTASPSPLVGPNSSTGAAALHFESREGLPTSIQTGWLGPSFARVNVGIKIDPVTNGGPLYAVDMPHGALLEASWGNDKKVVFKALSGVQTDGMVSVRHTLTPSIDFDFSFIKLSFDATKLLGFIPGASFQFDSQAHQQFAPWAFTPIDTKLTAPDLDNAELFSLSMKDLPDFVANAIDGSFGVRATTEPTFSYKTTKITLAGAAGALTDAAGNVTLPAVDGDAMDLMATVEGTMSVAGAISVQPFVKIAHLAGLSLFGKALDLGIDVFSQDYSVPPQTVAFQTVNVHVPMPNVRVPAGTVTLANANGGKGSVTIENTGEKAAEVTFQTASGPFSVTADRVTIGPKSKYDLSVTVTASEGTPTGEIKVLSNDADSPEQTIKVGAAAGDGSAPGGEKNAAGGDKADSGCGCKTAGASGTSPAGTAGGLAGFALAVATALSRRRRTRR